MGTAATASPSTTIPTLLVPGNTPLPWEPTTQPNDRGSDYVITAAASAQGVEAGDRFRSWTQLSALVAAKFDAMGRGTAEPSRMMLASARPEDWQNAYSNIARSSIASLGFSREHDFVMAHQHDWFTIERACNEARLPGGSLTPEPSSLTAAPGTPGWCAPCEVRYDFCPPAEIWGMVDLPTVIATRGCLTYPMMPDFGVLYQNAGFCYPASDYDLDTNPNPDPVANPYWAKNKPCMPVDCPEQQTCTLDPCGICLQSSILVERAYPELIQYFIANALVAWGHKMNCHDLNEMIAASTPVTVPRNQTGPGATASVLEVLEFYGTWLRYKYRLGPNASVEAVLPEWLKGVLRSDLSKRMGIDLLNVTDQMIDNWMALRKIRVQWVLGLDEAFCDTGTTNPPTQIDPKTSLGFGGNPGALGIPGPPPVPPILWPKMVSFLMYPAGTFFRARMNLVNIEAGLVDSALLKRNERLLLFIEEADAVCKRCYESLYITMDICPSGQTGGGSISQPVCETLVPPGPPTPPPPPVITTTEATGDTDHMTVSVLVDNHGNGPVTVNWGQTPALPAGTNPGDGTTPTVQKYSENGTWTITATDASDPSLTNTAQVTVPYAGAPPISLNVVDTAPPSRTWQATWNNFSEGQVKLFWGDSTDPAGGTTKPVSGNDTHTYDAAVVSPVTVRVEDATTPTRFAEQQINLP